MFDELSPPYSTIVADPPWPYSGFAGSVGRGGFFAQGERAAVQVKPLPYTSMTCAEIAALPVGDLSDRDGWLWLWTTSRFLPDALPIAAAWGYTYRQIIVWNKTGNPPPFGGTIAPPHAEFLLLFAKGKPMRTGRAPSSVINAPKQMVHSHKPGCFLDLVESVTPGPYVELFARAPRLGWDSWGYGYESAEPVRRSIQRGNQ